MNNKTVSEVLEALKRGDKAFNNEGKELHLISDVLYCENNPGDPQHCWQIVALCEGNLKNNYSIEKQPDLSYDQNY